MYICYIVEKKSFFLLKCLRMCIFCCTFAAKMCFIEHNIYHILFLAKHNITKFMYNSINKK